MNRYFCRDCGSSWTTNYSYHECITCSSPNVYSDYEEGVAEEEEIEDSLEVYEIGDGIPEMVPEDYEDSYD
jgi:uncharacterized protein YbaR (Trm112 family)